MHYIPRSKMPQVNEADLPQLVHDLVEAGLAPAFAVLDPAKLHHHQRISHIRALAMPEAIRRKPSIVSGDDYVVDGNHRTYAQKFQRELANAIVVPRSFDEVVDFLFTLPYVYEIHHDTPIQN